MIDHQFFGKIAGIFATVGFVPYIIDILRGKIPSKASWIIWSVIGISLGFSYRTAGADASVWVPVSYAICPLLVLAVAFYKDRSPMKAWPRTDKIFLCAGILCFVPWAIFKVAELYNILPAWGWILPRVTLFGGIIIDSFGSIPTIVKSWKDPKSESFLGWIAWGIGNILNLLAIEIWVPDIAAYPIYMAIPSSMIIPALFMFWKQNKPTP